MIPRLLKSSRPRLRQLRPRPGTVIAIVALVVASAGSGYAANSPPRIETKRITVDVSSSSGTAAATLPCPHGWRVTGGGYAKVTDVDIDVSQAQGDHAWHVHGAGRPGVEFYAQAVCIRAR